MVARVGLFVDRLDPCGVIDVRDRRDLAARDVELFDSEELFLLCCHRDLLVRMDRSDQ